MEGLLMEKLPDLCMLLLLIPAAAEDWKTHRINGLRTAAVGIAGLAYHVVFTEWAMQDAISALLPGFFLLLFVVIGKKIGTGDAVLFMAVGAVEGGWKCFYLLWISMILCFIAGLVLILFFHMKKDRQLPAAPFVLAAYLVSIVFG